MKRQTLTGLFMAVLGIALAAPASTAMPRSDGLVQIDLAPGRDLCASRH
jgi:hypothetical protein